MKTVKILIGVTLVAILDTSAIADDNQKKGKDKKPREARKALDAALNLTEEQQAQREEFRGKRQQLNAEIITALRAVLTAEQQELLLRQKKQRTGKGEHGKKNRKRKKEAAYRSACRRPHQRRHIRPHSLFPGSAWEQDSQQTQT